MPFPTSNLAHSCQYTDIHLIGQGGFGLIYAATQPLTQRVVAVKEVLPSSASYAAAFTRFRSEIRLQARLSHPNIVQVYDAAEDPQTHELYLIGEYAPGGSLADDLAARGPLAQDESLRVALDLCAALEQLAAAGIVHGDIKPSNILLVRDGQGRIAQAKLSDFGSAIDRRGPPPTIVPGQPTLHPVTPAYMAPELATAANIQDIDGRADLYALGLVLWEMLTCTIYMLLPPPQLRELNRYVAQPLDGLAAVIAKATCPNPDDRYQAPPQLAQDLRDILAGRWGTVAATTLLPRASLRPQALAPAAQLPAPAAQQPLRWRTTWARRLPMIAVGVMFIAGLLIPAGAFWRASSQNVPRPELTRTKSTAVPTGPTTVTGFSQLARWGNGTVHDIAYTPDGSLLAVATALGVSLYDTHTMTFVRFMESQSAIQHITFAPDSQSLAVIATHPARTDRLNQTVELWQVRDGTLLQSFTGYAAVFLPDGQTIALASQNKGVQLRRIRDGALLGSTEVRGGIVTFAPDGRILASVAFGNQFSLWQHTDDTFSFLQKVPALPGGISDLTIAPDGQALAAGSNDGTIHLWRASEHDHLQTLTGHTQQILDVAFSPDSQILASASGDGTIRLWRVSDGALLQSLQVHTDLVWHMIFSPDGQTLVSASGDGMEKLWRVSDGALLHTLTNNTWRAGGMAFAPDSQTIAITTSDGPVTLWQVGDGVLFHTLDQFTAPVRSLALAPDGQTLASTTDDGQIRLWRISDGVLLRTFGAAKSAVTHVAFSLDGQTLAAATSDGSIQLWRVSDGTLLRTIARSAGTLGDVLFAPDGQTLAAVGMSGTVELWQISDGTLVDTLRGYSLAFSPDGQTLALSAQDGSVRFLRRSDGELIRTLEGHTKIVIQMAFAPNGQTLATASLGGDVSLWRVSDGALITPTFPNQMTETHLAFASDSQTLAIAGDDRMQLWRVSDMTLLQELVGHRGPVTGLAFAATGQLLASGGEDGTIRLWGVQSQ